MIVKISNGHINYRIKCSKEIRRAFTTIKQLKDDHAHTRGDLVYKLNALYALMKGEGQIYSYLDLMAGAGFSAGLIRALNRPGKMVLNDIQRVCYDNLKRNFPKSFQMIENEDCMEINEVGFDVCFFDPPSFTLNKIDELPMFRKSLTHANNIYMYTDSFAYSLKPYDGTKMVKYLFRLSNFLRDNQGCWQIDKVYLHPNTRCATIKLTKRHPHQKKHTFQFVGCPKPFTVTTMKESSLLL
jgi:hypothetical protein